MNQNDRSLSLTYNLLKEFRELPDPLYIKRVSFLRREKGEYTEGDQF